MSDGHSIIHFAKKEDITNLEDYINTAFNLDYYNNLMAFSRHSNHVRCSDPYWTWYDKDKKFLFSFMYMPEWIELAVEQFNSVFKNIKVILHRNINGTEIKTYSVFENEQYVSKIFKYRIPVFEIKYKAGYLKGFQKLSNLLIHHYFRMLSILEDSTTLKTKNILHMETPPSDLDIMDLIISENNINSTDRYRKLCEYDITREDLLALDNLSLVRSVAKNNIFSNMVVRKQTGILLSLKLAELLKKQLENPFKEGDYVKANIYGRKYYGRTIIGKVLDTSIPNQVKIKEVLSGEKFVYIHLLDHISEEEYFERTRPSW